VAGHTAAKLRANAARQRALKLAREPAPEPAH
jgi:hypothetical protein